MSSSLLVSELGAFFVVVGGQETEATAATGSSERAGATADVGTRAAATVHADVPASAAVRTPVTSPPPAGAARREDASTSQSNAAVRELTSLLLKGQSLLLEVAGKQQTQGWGMMGGGQADEGVGSESSSATDARPQSSTRLTFDTLAFDEASATVDAVLSAFLSDLAANNALGKVLVSAQGSGNDDADNGETANELLNLDDDDDDEEGGSISKDGGDGAAVELDANNNTNTNTNTNNDINSTAAARGRPGCLPAIYATPTRQPPKLLGGALAITFTGGECRVVQGLFPGTRKIECDSPSVEYALVPPGFEWSHESPEMWAGESCDGETTRCGGGTGTTTSFFRTNRVDVPVTEPTDQEHRAATAQSGSDLCRAASKDSLIDSAFEENAALFKAVS